MSSSDLRFSAASAGIKQLKEVVVEQINDIEDTDKQLKSVAVVVNNFVMQTLQVVTDNDDITGVNEQLASSLIQIRDFVTNRPIALKGTVQKLEQKLDAYDQCLLILDEALKIEVEPEETVQAARRQKQDAIHEKTDPAGKYLNRRKTGTRPEKLKDIRSVEASIAAQKNSEEDI